MYVFYEPENTTVFFFWVAQKDDKVIHNQTRGIVLKCLIKRSIPLFYSNYFFQFKPLMIPFHSNSSQNLSIQLINFKISIPGQLM